MKAEQLLRGRRYQPFRDIVLFAVLILGFHFFFRYWANHLHFVPFQDIIGATYEFMVKALIRHSVWALTHLTNLDFSVHGRVIIVKNGHLLMHPSCSSLKQSMEWIVLMTVFPGPWKHKIWFIPMGLVIVHIINVFRIVGLAATMIYLPQHWHFAHSYIFRPFFYVVMFGLWVWWVEKYRNPSREIKK